MSQNTLRTPAERLRPEGTPPTWAERRPADWLPMPTFTPGEQKFAILVKVHNGPNPLRMNFTCAAGFTVDWGDGSAPENLASGVADHRFSWAGCDPDTLTSEGYRQALVIVTPQGSGTFTEAFFHNPHPDVPSSTVIHTGILDVEFSSPTCTLPIFGDGAGNRPKASFMRHVRAHSAVVASSWAYRFASCVSLESVEGLELSTAACTSALYLFYESAIEVAPMFDTSVCTSMERMFSSCVKLVSVPVYDYTAATAINNMFGGCYKLASVGNFNTTSTLTNMAQAFISCLSLRSVGSFAVTSSVTTASLLFSGCISLITAPAMVLTSCLSIDGIFGNCVSLVEAPALTVPVANNASNMFSGCGSLTTVPAYNLSAVTNVNSMFSNCLSLRTAPAMNLSAATTFVGMFAGCTSLVSVPAYDLSAGVTFTQMFVNCVALESFDSTTTTSAVTITQMFSGCIALKSVSMPCAAVIMNATMFSSCIALRSVVLTGLRYTVAVNGNQLGATALDALYTSLGTAVGAQVVTVTTNPGTTGDTASIATSKGWTVTGS